MNDFLSSIYPSSKPENCMEECLIKTLEVVSNISEIRDPYTALHQKKVAKLSVSIAKEMSFDSSDILGIYLGAIVHDIGKVSIPSEILSYPGKLSPEQCLLIKKHPEAGHDLLKTIDFPWPIKDIVLLHHERLDGSGYPYGLKAKEIPRSVKIVSVADVYEAMTTHRPYRPALGHNEALKEITLNAGILYDKEVVAALEKLF